MVLTRCRYCGVEREFRADALVSDILYCSEECWIEDWKRNGVGLVHPRYVQYLKKECRGYD